MSIQRNHVPGNHPPAHGAEASHGRNKPNGNSSGADAGGFSSLMLTLGAQDSEPGNSLALGELAPLTDPLNPLDPSGLLAQALAVPPDAKILERQVKSNDADLKLAPLPADTALQAKDSLRAQADLRNSALEPAPEALPTAPIDPTLAKDIDSALTNEWQEKAQAAAPAHSAHKPVLVDDPAKQSKGRLELQSHEQKDQLSVRELTETFINQSQLAQVAGTSETGPKSAERLKERLALKQIGAGESGAWGYQALAEAGRIQAPAEVGASASLSPEMMVAQQVNYLIGHDVQNAELRFDGLGEGTVKVNISMQGNEASVEFRSDQAETRQILEDAVSHLKDLLGSEGLVLSSVSVGHSGAGSADARPARPAPTARTSLQVASPVDLTQALALRTSRATGQAIDLFV